MAIYVTETSPSDLETTVMCGIFSVISNIEINRRSFKEGLRSLNHRGPDHQGVRYFTDCDTALKHSIAMGHQRLSIVDVGELSNQPFTAQFGSKTYHIIYNGEIYNYRELRERLEKQFGMEFQTRGDTEVILAYYSVYGCDAFKQFDGVWALQIYDEQANKIIVARDRLGEKPLYLMSQENYILFASQIRPILIYNENSRINRLELDAMTLSGYYGDLSTTCFKDIFAVQPGSYCELDLSNMRSFSIENIRFTEYWSLAAPSSSLRRYDLEKCITDVDKLLHNAVASRVPLDGNISLSLSGGVDSNLIANILKRQSTEAVAFSNIFSDARLSSLNEEENIEKAALKLNYKLRKTEFSYHNPDYVLDIFKAKIENYEAPISDIGFSGYAVYSEIRKSDFKVVLEGQGADELFGGYEAYRSPFNIIRSNIIQNLYLLIDKKVTLSDFILRYSNIQSLYRFYIRHQFRKKCDVLGVEFSKELEEYLVFREFLSFPDFRNRANVNKFIRAQILRNLSYLLFTGDRDSMLHSVESRLPFTHHKLVEYCVRMPVDFFYRNHILKYALKKIAEQYLPNYITYPSRKKIGYPDAFDHYVEKNTDLQNAVRNVLEKQKSKLNVQEILNNRMTRRALANQFFLENFS